MAKTISVHEEAYERLRNARRSPRESFTQVIMRATWPETTTTARDLLSRLRERGATLEESELEEVERAKEEGAEPEDKWQR